MLSSDRPCALLPVGLDPHCPQLQRTLASRSKMEAVQAAVRAAEAAKAEAAKAAGDGAEPPNTSAADLERIKPTLESLYEDSPDCVQVRTVVRRFTKGRQVWEAVHLEAGQMG